MGSSENIQIKPLPFGSFSADGIQGKIDGLSPDSMNIRYDLFGGIESILGNTAFNVNQVGGAYGAGADIFQYVRKDGTFDFVLSRQKAEGKVYKVPGGSSSPTNLISGTSAFNAGTPSNGDNLLFTTGLLKQNPPAQVYLNLDFEDGISGGSPTAWSALAGGGLKIIGVSEHGSKSCEADNSNDNVAISGTIGIYKVSDDSSIATANLQSLSAGANTDTGWVASSILEASLTTAIGLSVYIKIIAVINAVTTSSKSSSFTYQFGGVSFWSAAVNTIGNFSTLFIDDIGMEVTSPKIDFGVIPSTFGNLTGNIIVTPYQHNFRVRTSNDGVNWNAPVSVGSNITSSGNFSISLTSVTPTRYLEWSTNNLRSGTINNIVVGAQWVSATQDLTATPISWNMFSASYSDLGQTLTFEMDTSIDGSTWDGYAVITTGNAPTNTLRRYFRYRVTFNTTDYTLLPQLNSLSLKYTLSRATSALVQLTGWTGTGYNTYFGVLNNYLIISDGTVAPMSWNGTGTAFSAIATAPSGMYSETHYSRYFLAYSSANPSRLWYSNDTDPLTWDTTNNFIDINPDDGDFITGIKSYGGVLYVFKHKMAYMIQGNNFNPVSGNYSVQPMQQLPGCESHNSIVVASDGNMYWYSNKGLVQYNGSSFPNFVGRGFIDQTVKSAGFKQNLADYNQISAVDFISYNEIWFSFGHTIYAYNYVQQKWGRVFFDNNSTGFTVFSLVKYSDPYYSNILSWTGNNVIEQWQDSPTFYVGSLPTPFTTAIQSYYTTDSMDDNWYASKNNFKALLSLRPLTATAITLTSYMDFSTTPIDTPITITCPTVSLPDQYRREDLPGLNGRRLQLKLSCSALQFGISDIALHRETADSGRL